MCEDVDLQMGDDVDLHICWCITTAAFSRRTLRRRSREKQYKMIHNGCTALPFKPTHTFQKVTSLQNRSPGYIVELCFTDKRAKVVAPRNFNADVFAHKRFHTKTLLHTKVFTHRCFAHGRFSTQTFLHADVLTLTFTQTPLHTDACKHIRLYRQISQAFFLNGIFMHGRFDTHAHMFPHRRFSTQTPLLTDVLFHTDVFTHRRLHTYVFTHRHFYTLTTFLHAYVCTDWFHRPFHSHTFLHTIFFNTYALT